MGRLATIIALHLTFCGCALPRLPTGRLRFEAANTVQREHLVIHSNFPIPRHQQLLDELVVLRADVAQRLKLPSSDQPIHVYLFETAKQYRAFLRKTLPYFPQRRACFVRSDTELSVFAQWSDLIAIDLRHEVTHGCLHAVCHNLPLWLDEGLAEYFEVGRGHGGINVPHHRLLALRRRHGDWRPELSRLESLRLPSEMGQLHYAEAWAWVHFLLETTPQRRQLLEDYVARVRRTGEAQSLWQWLLEQEPQAVAALQQHLESLGQ